MEESVRKIQVSWNKENANEIELAKRKFEKYIRQGWLAFATSADGKNVQIFTFDPALEKISLIPLSEGG